MSALGWSKFGLGVFDSVANVIGTMLNNKHQERLVDKQNQAAAAQADLAYERSKASNQVGLMQQAGMSKAGALNAINNGASYTPAPVQAAQTQAPQFATAEGLQALIDIGENAKQREAAEKLQRMQLKAAEEAQMKQLEDNDKQRASAEKIAQLNADTTNRNADRRLEFDKEQFDRLAPYQIRQIEANIKKINSDVTLTQTQEKDLAYKYAEYVDTRSTRDAVSLLSELEAVYNYHITENDFNDFRRSYMWYNDETGEYEYIKHTKELTYVEAYVAQFWDVVAKILPANKIGSIVRAVLK